MSLYSFIPSRAKSVNSFRCLSAVYQNVHVFKEKNSYFRPKSETLALPSVEAACEGDLHPENKGPVPHEDYSEDSLASRGSSGFGSLPRKTRSSLVTGGM